MTALIGYFVAFAVLAYAFPRTMLTLALLAGAAWIYLSAPITTITT